MKRIKRFFRELFGLNTYTVISGDLEITVQNVYGSSFIVEWNGQRTEILTSIEGKIIHTIHHDSN